MVYYDDPTYLDAVFAALKSLLSAATFPGTLTLKSVSRMMSIPEQVAAANQPMLILYQGPIKFEQKQLYGPIKNEIDAIAILFVIADGSRPEKTAQDVSYLIWGIKKAFDTRPPYQRQTLGGLVHHCWIDGDVVPEYLDQQVVITFPIKIHPE